MEPLSALMLAEERERSVGPKYYIYIFIHTKCSNNNKNDT